MLYLNRYSFVLILTIAYLSCSRNPTLTRVKKGNYILEANFKDGRIWDGKASYYDSLGKLVNLTMYDKGLREGVAITYFPNNIVADSVKFICDKENGYWKYYDSNGNNVYQNYYYFGLRYGPELIYENNRLRDYRFSNFNRLVSVECFYDSLENLDSIALFKMDLTINEFVYENRHVQSLFAYLPKIPKSNQSFSIGLTNKEHQDKKLYDVEGHNFFIDTLLPIPTSGWHYYLACNLKSNSGLVKKYYIEEIILK